MGTQRDKRHFVRLLLPLLFAAAFALLLLPPLVTHAQSDTWLTSQVYVSAESVYNYSSSTAPDCNWNGYTFECDGYHTSSVTSGYSGIGPGQLYFSIPLSDVAAIAINIVYTKSAAFEYYTVLGQSYTQQSFRDDAAGGFSGRLCMINSAYEWPGEPTTLEKIQELNAAGLGCDETIYEARDISSWNLNSIYIGVRSRQGYFHFDISGIYALYFGTPEPEPPGPSVNPGGYCSFPVTSTQVITSQTGVTQTIVTTSTYTTPANLLLNGGFEEGGTSGPAEWYQTVGNAAYWWQLDNFAHSGQNSVSNYPGLQLEQDLNLAGAGLYAVGFYASCTSFTCAGDTIPLFWNGVNEATATGIISGYTMYSGTNFAATSITNIMIDMTTENGNVRIDDVFLYPILPDGSPSCDPELYPIPEDIGDDTAVDCVMYPYSSDCLVVPVGGAGTTCYSCAPPGDMSSLSVSYWIAWLGCVIRNMFSCSLRVWLMNLGNSLLAIVGSIVMAVNWINVEAGQGVGFFVQMYNRFAEWAGQVPGSVTVAVSNVVNVGRSSFDWFWIVFAIAASLFALLMSLVTFLIAGGAALVALLIAIVSALSNVFTAPPIDIVAEIGASGMTGNGAYAAGTTIAGEDLVSRLLYGMALADSIVVDWGMYPVLIVVGGVMGFGVLMWVVYQWKDGIAEI